MQTRLTVAIALVAGLVGGLLTRFVAPPVVSAQNPPPISPGRGRASIFSSREEFVGKPAPGLSLSTIDGKTLNLQEFQGKIVLLEFWASWCIPCKRQMPTIAALYHKLRDQGLVLLGVNEDETAGQALDYLKQQPDYDCTSIYDHRLLQDTLKLHVIPALILIDKQGVIIEYQIGAASANIPSNLRFMTAEAKIIDALKQQGFELP
jgi:thiol-disulfide isomerase/thioredoxin